MKKIMFALAFTFCAVMAFASNPPVKGDPPAVPQQATLEKEEFPCIVCGLCKGVLICQIGYDCDDALDRLINEFESRGCSDPTKTPQSSN
ncbi:MAG: hypothetical protein U0U46_15155 [Saprospiraceae bacterium]